MQLYKLFNELRNNKLIKIIDPIGYIDFMCLQKNARIAITDSVGIQEETTFLVFLLLQFEKTQKDQLRYLKAPIRSLVLNTIKYLK